MATAPIQHYRTGGVWGGNAPLSRPASASGHTYLGAAAPTSPRNGDVWIDNTRTPPVKQYFWGATPTGPGGSYVGGSWNTETGTHNYVQATDPTLAGSGVIVNQGDIWTQPEVSIPNPNPHPAITQVWDGSKWAAVSSAPGIASRTFISATAPPAPSNGDLWIDTAFPVPVHMYYWGQVPPGPGGVPAAVPGAWHDDQGKKTFIQDTLPVGAVDGDVWYETIINNWRDLIGGVWVQRVTSPVPLAVLRPVAIATFDDQANPVPGVTNFGVTSASLQAASHYQYRVVLAQPAKYRMVQLTMIAEDINSWYYKPKNAATYLLQWVSNTEFWVQFLQIGAPSTNVDPSPATPKEWGFIVY